MKTLSLTREGTDEETIRAEKILIASGSRPIIPHIEGLEGTEYITSDEALRLSRLPRVLTIIGGGYVGCELAHFFGSLGPEINIIQRNTALVPNEDQEVSKKITEIYSRKFNVYLGFGTESVLRLDKNEKSVDREFYVVAKNSDGKSLELIYDQLLML